MLKSSLLAFGACVGTLFSYGQNIQSAPQTSQTILEVPKGNLEVVGVKPGIPTVCPIGEFAGIHRTAAPQAILDKIQSRDADDPCATFIVNYTDFTPAAQAAFQAAVDIWSYSISSTVPIEIDAKWIPMELTKGGGASPTYFLTFVNGLSSPIALANQIIGFDFAPDTADIIANFNSNINWYLGTDGNCPSDQTDFVSVVLHEIGHGLGFISTATIDSISGAGSYAQGIKTDFDYFLALGQSGLPLILLEESDLSSAFVSNNVFSSSLLATEANASIQPKIFAPLIWKKGSSMSHWDDDTFPAGSPNSLMTHMINTGESIHDPGEITLGMFKDMGWLLCGESPECLAQPLVLIGDAQLCPGENATITNDELNYIPDGGGIGIQFLNSVTQSVIQLNSLQHGFSLPFTFNNDLNGILSSNQIPALLGNYNIVTFVFTDVNNIGNSICSVSSNHLSLDFLDENNSACATTTIDLDVDWNQTCDARALTVSFYQPGSSVMELEIFGTMNSLGAFTVDGVNPGIYDILIKVDGMLAKKESNYTVASSGNTLSISGLLRGDADNNNIINMQDFSTINLSFGYSMGDSQYSYLSDLNCDGTVNVIDISVLNVSFGLIGATPGGDAQ